MGRIALVCAMLGALVLILAPNIASAFDLSSPDIPEQFGLVLIFYAALYASYKYLTHDGTW